MKRKNFRTIIILAICALTFSCKKEKVENSEVNPMEAYLTATKFNENKIEIKSFNSTYEFGLSFKPLVNGKITALVVKVPDVNSSLRLTIWDKATATILKTETINYNIASKEVVVSIEAINVVEGTEYMVTVNNNSNYSYKRNDDSDVTYPIIVGNLSITGFARITGAIQTLPNVYKTNFYSGDISFKFKKD